MTNMLKVKARWHGFTGSPGYSNFFFREWSDGSYTPTTAEASAAVAKVHNFFDSLKTGLPPVVNVQVEQEVEVIEDTNGQISSILTAAAKPNVVGTATTAQYSAASGACITWLTGGVRNGRRVRGRTFLVPLSNVIYDVNGTLSATWLQNIQYSASILTTDDASTPTFGVYSRPSGPGATDGTWQIATGSRVPDMAAVLRSRRD